MAKSADKKILEENQQTLKRLWQALLVVKGVALILFVLVRPTFWQSVIIVTSALLAGVTLYVLNKAAQPGYSVDPSGQLRLVHGGHPLTGSTSGAMIQYTFDIFYVACFVELGTFLTIHLAWIYLVIPIYASVKLWSWIGPLLMQSRSAPVHPTNSPKQKIKYRRA